MPTSAGERSSTSRRCSVRESVAASLRCRLDVARYFLGLMVQQVSVPEGLPRVRAPSRTRRCGGWRPGRPLRAASASAPGVRCVTTGPGSRPAHCSRAARVHRSGPPSQGSGVSRSGPLEDSGNPASRCALVLPHRSASVLLLSPFAFRPPKRAAGRSAPQSPCIRRCGCDCFVPEHRRRGGLRCRSCAARCARGFCRAPKRSVLSAVPRSPSRSRGSGCRLGAPEGVPWRRLRCDAETPLQVESRSVHSMFLRHPKAVLERRPRLSVGSPGALVLPEGSP